MTNMADVLESKHQPDVPNLFLLPVDMLEPYTKITAEEHYGRVVSSIKDKGLLNPLIVVQVTEDEWMDDVREQGDVVLAPDTWGLPIRYRIQCGNHRYWAIKSYFPDIVAVSCLLFNNRQQAYEACQQYRRDRTWKRT